MFRRRVAEAAGVKVRTFLALATLLLVARGPTWAQSLPLQLSGLRVRPIEAASLFHTLFGDFFPQRDGTMYVQTGDIPAMWLRDSSAQTMPYVRFEPFYPALSRRLNGVIQRNAKNVLADPYANAFTAGYHVWERKWEIDSLAWPVLLAWQYWTQTHDRAIFTPAFHAALRTVVATYRCQQRHDRCIEYSYDYFTRTHDAYNPETGMIWGAFRPSDDAVTYRFNIPQEALAVVALIDLAALSRDGYADGALARRATTIAARVQVGIARYGLVYSTRRGGAMYAYETDGLGHYELMDDANIPNLLALPEIGWCSNYDPTYINTRNFALSSANPWYFHGRYAQGLGSPHTPYGFVWPLGIIARALTSTSSSEVEESISTLAETDSADGLIHESFYPDGYWRFTRAEFGWANAMYAELVFRSIAGFAGTPTSPYGTMLPFELPSSTPPLERPLARLRNAELLIDTLGQLLARANDFADPSGTATPGRQPEESHE